MPSSAAQDEFDALVLGTGRTSPSLPHQEDRFDPENTSPPRSPSSATASNKKHSERTTLRSNTQRDSDNEDFSDSDAPRQKSGKMRARYFVPSSRSEANTGPKGVIADAQAYEAARRNHRGATPRSQKMFPTLPVAAPSNPQPSSHYRVSNNHARSGSWLADDDESDDDDFLSRWRQSRLEELSKGTKGARPARRSTSSPRYGFVQGVDADGYLDAIEKSNRDTIVIVFIYDDMSEVSQLIEHSVHSVARSYPTVRFVKLHYEEAQMEPLGVPAMVAYRGGDKFSDMVPIIDEIPEDDELSAETLAIAMKRKSMLP